MGLTIDDVREETELQARICNGRYVTRKGVFGVTMTVLAILTGVIVASLGYASAIGERVATQGQEIRDHNRRIESMEARWEQLDRVERKLDRIVEVIE